MRNDMFKVIVERPRHGSRYADCEMHRPRRHEGSGDAGEAPARESLTQRHRWRKSLNENLNPLRRWLERQVGRPWDRVYAELCAGIDRRSTVQQHIHQHVGDFVAVVVRRVDGELRYPFHWDGLRPLATAWAPRLYVDPDSGLLRLNKARDLARRTDRVLRAGERAAPPRDRREIDPWRQLHRLDGIWYEVDLAPIVAPAQATRPLFDVIRHRPVQLRAAPRAAGATVADDRSLYGRDGVYAWRRRQLSARELATHGLKND